MIFYACRSITWASGKGLGPGSLESSGPKWHSTIGLMPFHWAQKILEFLGPTPFHLLSKWICTHQKQYARSYINHRCINSYSFSQVSSKPVELK